MAHPLLDNKQNCAIVKNPHSHKSRYQCRGANVFLIIILQESISTAVSITSNILKWQQVGKKDLVFFFMMPSNFA